MDNVSDKVLLYSESEQVVVESGLLNLVRDSAMFRNITL